MANEDAPRVTDAPAPVVDQPKEPVNLEARMAELEVKHQQSLQQIEERLKEAQRTIQDLSNTNAVLDQRLRTIDEKPSPNVPQTADNLEQAVEEAMADVSVDPKLAARRLATIMKAREENLQKSRINEVEKLRRETADETERRLYVEELKRQHPDIMGTAFEFKARQVAEELMATKRMPFKEAVEAGIKAAKKEKEELIMKEVAKNKQASPPPPPGSQGEQGANLPPSLSKKETKEPETMEEALVQNTQDAVSERMALANKKARGK